MKTVSYYDLPHTFCVIPSTTEQFCNISKMYINEFTIRQSNAIIHNVTFHWFQISMPISIRFVTDVPFIVVFQANQNQINESSTFGLTCMVNSSTSTNMSIQNKETGEVIRTGMSTDSGVHVYCNKHCRQHQVKSGQDLREF